MSRFDQRLEAELRREFDSQAVETPAPYRARYDRVAGGRRLPGPRVGALVVAMFAIGLLVGLAYANPGLQAARLGRHIGVLPSFAPSIPAPASAGSPAPVASRPPAGGAGGLVGTPGPGSSPVPSAPPPSAAPPVPALSDDFERDPVGANPPGGWRVDDGAWAGVVSGGSHVVEHMDSQAGGHLVAGSPAWSGYTVSAVIGGGLLNVGSAGVAGYYQDPGDDYECVVSELAVGSQLQLVAVQGGRQRTLGTSTLSIDLGASHTVSLALHGGQLTCALDGAQQVRAQDSTFTAGRVALVASDGEQAEFDDVRVTAP